jgi:four helix bundle protein
MRLPLPKLQIWTKSIALTKLIYVATRHFPAQEMYGLTQQMRRSAVSVCSNIAEGRRRRSDNEFSHFLAIAHGSLAELETQIIVSIEIGYILRINGEKLLFSIQELSKMLHAFRAKVSAR